MLLAARLYVGLHVAWGLALPSITMGHDPVLPLPHLSEVVGVLMGRQLPWWHFALSFHMPGNAALAVGIQRCSQGLPLEPGMMDMADPTAGVPPAALPPPR